MKVILSFFLFLFVLLPLPAKADLLPDFSPTLNIEDPHFVDSLRSKAEHGDATAELELGDVYYHGIYTQPQNKNLFNLPELRSSYLPWGTTMKDLVEAKKWWHKAADQGNAEAQYKIGRVARSNKEGEQWYRKAADQGYGPAEEEMGSISSQSYQNAALALEWYNKAAIHGDVEADMTLANIYMFDPWGTLKGQKNPDMALSFFMKSAQLGDSNAQEMLGDFYAKGDHVQQDPIKAFMWLSLTLQNNCSDTRAEEHIDKIIPEMTPEQLAEGKRLAVEMFQKQGKPQYPFSRLLDLPATPSEVEQLRIKAMAGDESTLKAVRALAEKGNIEAQLLLGGAYSHNISHCPVVWYTKRDDAESMKWYRMAADHGNAQAQYWLGMLYHNKDSRVMWVRKAADQGYPEALALVGGWHEFGTDMPQDFSEAFKRTLMAAERGDTSAQAQLYHMYESGIGVTPDPAQMYYWMLIATQRSSVRLQDHRLDRFDFDKYLTKDQQKSIEEKAREWKPISPPLH